LEKGREKEAKKEGPNWKGAKGEGGRVNWKGGTRRLNSFLTGIPGKGEGGWGRKEPKRLGWPGENQRGGWGKPWGKVKRGDYQGGFPLASQLLGPALGFSRAKGGGHPFGQRKGPFWLERKKAGFGPGWKGLTPGGFGFLEGPLPKGGGKGGPLFPRGFPGGNPFLLGLGPRGKAQEKCFFPEGGGRRRRRLGGLLGENIETGVPPKGAPGGDIFGEGTEVFSEKILEGLLYERNPGGVVGKRWGHNRGLAQGEILCSPEEKGGFFRGGGRNFVCDGGGKTLYREDSSAGGEKYKGGFL